MGDRFNISSQLEHLQMKYSGTGHADTSKFEWVRNQHRDSLTSYIGHASMLNYFAIAQNQAVGRTRYNMMQRITKPCGEERKETEGEIHAAAQAAIAAAALASTGGAEQ
jgi:splicing factor 3B subunit 5